MNRKSVFAVAGIGLAALIAAIVVTVNLASGAPPVNVNALRANPAAIKGEFTVVGIMAGVSRNDATVFGLMDRAELACKSPNCEKFYLPVRFSGATPTVGDEVEAVGSFVATEGLFAASAVKVLRNHQL